MPPPMVQLPTGRMSMNELRKYINTQVLNMFEPQKTYLHCLAMASIRTLRTPLTIAVPPPRWQLASVVLVPSLPCEAQEAEGMKMIEKQRGFTKNVLSNPSF